MKFLLPLLLSLSAHGFYLNTNIGARFNNDTVKLYVTSNSTCSNAGISRSELLNIAYDGAKKYWNKVPTADLRIKKGGTYNTTNGNFLTGKLCVDQGNCDSATDVPQVSQIVIACNSNTQDNFTSSSEYAIGAPIKLSGKDIIGAVILINDSATTQFAGLSREEKVNVLAHEIGHAIGIGHSKDKAALMYYKNMEGRIHLGQDDIDAITYLYPNKLSGCDSIFGTIADASDDQDGPTGYFLTFALGVILMIYLRKLIFALMAIARGRHFGPIRP